MPQSSPPRLPYLLAALLAVLILGIDYNSKRWILQNLASTPFPQIPVFDILGVNFAITYATNHGAAWGLFAQWPQILVAIRLTALTALLIYLFCGCRDKLTFYAVTIIAAGALANLLDTFMYGYVVDIFQFVFWGFHFAIFNVADIAISCGVGLLLLDAFLVSRSDGAEKIPEGS